MNNERNEEKDWQAEGESLNTGSAQPSSSENSSGGEHHSHKKGGIHNNALYAAGMGRAATAAVDPHNSSSLEQTGTNPAYENPVGEGAGGSAGTGFTSGQSGAGATIATDTDYEQAGVGSTGKDDQQRQRADDAADEEA